MKVAVIGGGISGLAAVKAFRLSGHEVIAFERGSTIGGVWAPTKLYPGVQTQSPKDLYRFTDMAMPNDYPEWPKGPQVFDYLNSWTERHKIKSVFRFDSCVERISRPDDHSTGWNVHYERAGGKVVEHFDFVVGCTGQFSKPYKPDYIGVESFTQTGRIVLHSSEYQAAKVTKGRDVIVLGGSKSATDIAVYAAHNDAKSVKLISRKPVWRIPYFIAGINFKHLLYMRFQEYQFPARSMTKTESIVHKVLKPLIWGNFRALELLLRLQSGLGRWNMLPKSRIDDDVSCSLPILTPGLIELLAEGKVEYVNSSIERFQKKSVILKNGAELNSDVVILATGWELDVPWIPFDFRRKLIDVDGQYRLYRLAVNPDLPDVGFVGFNSSFCSILSSELIANWLVRYAERKLVNQPSEGQMRDDIQEELDWRRSARPSAMVYGGQCIAPFHFRYFDQILKDMGAGNTKQSFVSRWFRPPNADFYAKALKTIEK